MNLSISWNDISQRISKLIQVKNFFDEAFRSKKPFPSWNLLQTFDQFPHVSRVLKAQLIRRIILCLNLIKKGDMSSRPKLLNSWCLSLFDAVGGTMGLNTIKMDLAKSYAIGLIRQEEWHFLTSWPRVFWMRQWRTPNTGDWGMKMEKILDWWAGGHQEPWLSLIIMIQVTPSSNLFISSVSKISLFMTSCLQVLKLKFSPLYSP